MEIASPPQRQAAIKATSNLAESESSSDERKAFGDESDGYDATSRARGSKSKRDGKRIKKRGRKRPAADLQGVNGTSVGTSAKRRKREISTVLGSSRKRQYGGGIPAGDGINNESDLSQLSSDTEQEDAKPSTDLLLPLISPPSSSKRKQSSETQSVVLTSPDLDDDSDDLPDIGLVLSQQDVSVRKSKKPLKPPASTRKRPPRSDSPLSFASSPTLPPSSRRNGTGAEFSDHLESYSQSETSDIELDAVNVDDLCFAKGKSTENVYWPAKVLQVKNSLITSRGRRKRKKLYRVVFLDKKEKDIPRNWFYVSSQEEFRTCIIGQFESSHIEVVNDIDDDARQMSTTNASDRRSPSPLRSPSPTAISSLPLLSGGDYCDLTLPQQFAYVTPILKAIINGKATWALRRHEMYLAGGAIRDRLKTEGGLRGAVDARSADDLSHIVQKWCLGVRGRDFVGDEDEEICDECQQSPTIVEDENENQEIIRHTSPVPVLDMIPQEVPEHADVSADGIALLTLPLSTGEQVDKMSTSSIENSPKAVFNEAEPSSSTLPPSAQPIVSLTEGPIPQGTPSRQRQYGSPEYEKLSSREKVVYCLEVLLPEALNQILLWRTAERKSVEVMWNDVEEEERLHVQGEKLLRETDWVMDIMRLRGALVVRYGKGLNGNKGRGGGVTANDKALRRTRSGRIGGVVGSYKE